MSFLSLLFDAIDVLNKTIGVITSLQNEIEKQRQDLRKKVGNDIETEIAIVKDGEKWKAAILVDLPGNVEYNIAQVLTAFGLKVKELSCR